MGRCIEKDDCGNWQLRGVDWKHLREGQVITKDLFEKLYGALWKLMEYEDVDDDPDKLWSEKVRNRQGRGESYLKGGTNGKTGDCGDHQYRGADRNCNAERTRRKQAE